MTEYERGYKDGFAAREKGLVVVKARSEQIIKLVCDYFNTQIDKIKVKSRKREVVYVRQVLTYMLRRRSSMSCASIGRVFDQDHTTVINSINTIEDLMYSSEDTRTDINFLMNKLSITDPYEPLNTKPGIIHQESLKRKGDAAADSGPSRTCSSDSISNQER